MREVCKKCAHGKSRTRDSCYCTLYGIIIGYSKIRCDGFKEGESEQVQRKENRSGRESV